jgi:hypothetical protein
MLITINHPYIAYGYFTAADEGTIPGGYSPDFDMIELQSTADAKGPDSATLSRAMDLWTSSLSGDNKRYYLVGSTDTHDVWSWISGSTRTYAKIAAPFKKTQVNYIAALKAGHSYVSEGPLVEPLDGMMFGQRADVSRSRGVLHVSLRVSAVDGLKSVQVLRKGEPIRTLTFHDKTMRDIVSFSLKTSTRSWYSFIVEDQDGHRAVTNPIWTRMIK